MSAYKIIIIDDEPMILMGLQKLVQWEEINCVISGTAKNGEEGLDLIKRVQPDIVISDIRMPKLSGLEMIHSAQKIQKDTKFIVLTGHRDFDYAREALDLGVIKYLLKPTNIEDIKSAVLEAMMMLDDERSKEEDIKALREILNQVEADDTVETDDTEMNKGESETRIKYLAISGIQYMKENFDKKLDLQTVADHLYISTWYLCKVFKNELNNSFVQLLNEIRIQEAQRLLTESNKKVYEICELVGYIDVPYFTKTFKKYTGLTPNQYRNTNYIT